MKAFERNKIPELSHPEDVLVVESYLKRIGKVHVSLNTLEELYYDYSESVCCGWRTVDTQSLNEFADYLESVEI